MAAVSSSTAPDYCDHNMGVGLVLYEKVKESKVRGSHHNKQLIRDKPKVTIVSTRRDTMRKLFFTMKDYMKLKNHNDGNDFGKEWEILYSDDSEESDYLSKKVIEIDYCC